LERLTNEGKWRIDFTPGWYDNCVTDNLTITLNSPVPVSSYSLTPQPAQVIDNIITWQTSLDRGDRFNVRMESYDGGFLLFEVGKEKNLLLRKSISLMRRVI